MTDLLTDVLIPQMGVSVEDATVTNWHFGVGDFVERDQPVCEITTDKVDTEVLSPVDGVLSEIIIEEGQVALIGAVIARIQSRNSPRNLLPAEMSEQIAPEPVSVSVGDFVELTSVVHAEEDVISSSTGIDMNRLLAGALIDPVTAAREVTQRPGQRGDPICSPLARRLASASGIDIGTIKGTGLGGRVTRLDVASAVDQMSTPLPPRTPEESSMELPRGYADVPNDVVKTTHQRRTIAEHMIRSRRTAAHMTTEVEVDMSRVVSIRSKTNDVRAKVGLGRISYLPFIAVAACQRLNLYPNLNATFLEDRIIRWGEVNLSVAIDTPRGLLTPVIRRCDGLRIESIAAAIADFGERARNKTLTPDDMRAGTFTISNPGSVGASSAMAIINQPQVAILGVPVVVKRAWVVTSADGGEAIAPRPILTLALTFDHRAVDGAEATRFLVDVKTFLETSQADEYS